VDMYAIASVRSTGPCKAGTSDAFSLPSPGGEILLHSVIMTEVTWMPIKVHIRLSSRMFDYE